MRIQFQMIKTKKKKKQAKIKRALDWQDYVSLEDRKKFLRGEEHYTAVELHKFYQTPEGTEKELYRKLILHKRQVFLKAYINNEIELKEIDETQPRIFDKYFKWRKTK